MIPEALYRQIVDALPVLCVDVALRNARGEYLLVKRANEPLKGAWWVIGGRVRKGETLVEAAVRKVKEELALDVPAERFVCLGYYEDFFERDPLGVASGLHTLGVVFEAEIDGDCRARVDCQSDGWKFFERLPDRLVIKPIAGGGRPGGPSPRGG